MSMEHTKIYYKSVVYFPHCMIPIPHGNRDMLYSMFRVIIFQTVLVSTVFCLQRFTLSTMFTHITCIMNPITHLIRLPNV